MISTEPKDTQQKNCLVLLQDILPIDEKRPFFLISDTHFDHDNIIKYCNRPFDNREEMNHTLLQNWNMAVGKSDRVYFLGDMVYGRNSHPLEYWLNQLNGDIIFIKGSHDKSPEVKSHSAITLKYRDTEFLLIHDPADVPKEWDGWIIHGHHHNNKLKTFPFICGEKKTINVSAELINFQPINVEHLFKMNFKSVKYRESL